MFLLLNNRTTEQRNSFCIHAQHVIVHLPPSSSSSLHCPSGVQASDGLMLGPLTAHTFTLSSWPSPPKQDTLVATRPVPPLALTLMYFSTNVMFRTLHSNSTISLSTWLPSGNVRVHTELVFWTLGVGRVTGEHQ